MLAQQLNGLLRMPIDRCLENRHMFGMFVARAENFARCQLPKSVGFVSERFGLKLTVTR